MFRPVLMASLLWLAFIMPACDSLSTTAASQDSTAKIAAPPTFVEFLNGLQVISLPYSSEEWPPIPEGVKIPDIPAFYNFKNAARLSPVNGYTPVLYRGLMSEGKRLIYLITYDAAGKERSRLQLRGEGYIDKASPAYDEHYKEAYLYPEIGRDSLIELKCTYLFKEKGHVNVEKKACFFYHITPDGMITAIPRDTISLQAFAAAFPVKEMPFQGNTVQLKGLKLISRLTPYFNYGEVYVDSVYAYGKLDLDGLPTTLLFGRDAVEEEGGADAQVDLITYNEKGEMAGNLMIIGGNGIEGGTDKTGNVRIDREGNIRLDEKHSLILDNEAEFTENVEMQYAIQASGSIVPVEATIITITGSVFRKDMLLKQFNGNNFDYVVSEIPSPERLRLNMHFFQKGNECLMELYTTKGNGKVLDRYPVYTSLKKVKYEEAASKNKEEEDGYVVEKRGHYTKDVVIKLPGKEVHVDADGRFVK
ncbi:hypothetical protein [Chitinophaga sancti]|uniref:hypothetical protein n=1 Tax=Chitinophaga sancti TaxID=1004 RepID=UPI003F794AB4